LTKLFFSFDFVLRSSQALSPTIFASCPRHTPPHPPTDESSAKVFSPCTFLRLPIRIFPFTLSSIRARLPASKSPHSFQSSKSYVFIRPSRLWTFFFAPHSFACQMNRNHFFSTERLPPFFLLPFRPCSQMFLRVCPPPETSTCDFFSVSYTDRVIKLCLALQF